MSKTKLIQLFPSVESGLKQEEETVPLYWMMAYLDQIFRAIPKESQRTATFSKWKGSLIQYEKILSPVEEVEDGLGTVVSQLEAIAANNKGLTKAELEQLIANLQAL